MAPVTLVIGGTGMLGEPVARRLAQAGHRVRILSRHPAKAAQQLGGSYEYLQGDVEDASSLAQALEGCEGVHVNLMGGPRPADFDRIEHRGTARIAGLAAQMGLERLTYLSGAPAQAENFRDPASKAKFQAEAAIRESGVPYTIFQVTWMMESLRYFIRGNRALLIGRQPHTLRWIAVEDYAQMVARAYSLPATTNKTLFVVGPEPWTKREALEIYRRVVRPDLKITYLPSWLMRALAALSFSPTLRGDVRRMAFYDGIGDDFGDPAESESLLGEATTTLEEWCRQRAAGTHQGV